ncbi:hypothetical protein AB6N24_06360 [Cellulomonas sp. 179-A 4D5 NHS]|uniref:hypothetical protein n=1 Tax=Cellulomonas sp. 179-A 4D5 NHS TaxID=3142378 RepID=UPI0039A1782A
MSTTRLVEYPAVMPSGDPAPAHQAPLSIAPTSFHPALWPLANFHYASPWRPARLLNLLAEGAYLLACVEHRPGYTMSWTPFGMASPPHLFRFMSESIGLATCLEVAHQRYGWRPVADPMVNIDDVSLTADPPLWRTLHPKSATPPAPVAITTSRSTRPFTPTGNAVPDLLFLLGGQHLLAAEARGRSRLAGVHPTPEQQERCAQLQDWSIRAGGMQWFMSWTEMTGTESQVTLFDPGEPLLLTEDQAAVVRDADRARYDYVFLSAAQDELPGHDVAGVVFRLAQQAVPAGGRDEWLTLAVSDQNLRGSATVMAPSREAPWDDSNPVISTASTSRMVSLLTHGRPSRGLVDEVLSRAVG